jgi:hypothetical protein
MKTSFKNQRSSTLLFFLRLGYLWQADFQRKPDTMIIFITGAKRSKHRPATESIRDNSEKVYLFDIIENVLIALFHEFWYRLRTYSQDSSQGHDLDSPFERFDISVA